MAKITVALDDLERYKSTLWGGNVAVDLEKVLISMTSADPLRKIIGDRPHFI